ncbi:MAG: proprotein convertase P-domain-containing protein, partial [Saprospiraceae bacterium]|nr:proprotein convertase P-domain-containing protein [Saprospiraceae bacterium]
MKKLNKQLFVGFSFLFAMLFTNLIVAQQSITLEWAPGGFVGEVGYEVIQSSTGAVVACEQTGGAGPATQTVLLAEDETYDVRAFDSWGDGWNGGVLSATTSGVTLGTFSLANGGGNTNVCNGNNNNGIFLGSFFVAAPCDIECPADMTVDNDPGVCGADVTIPLATTGASCEGAFAFANGSTGQVPFNFNFTGIITTPGTLSGAVSVIGDVQLSIEVVGDFGAGFEVFNLTGPDGSTVVNVGGATPGDCATGNFTATVAATTWNGWVAAYGSNLTFTSGTDPDVDNICASSYWSVDAAQPIASLASVNDYNNTEDASDFYGVGETVVTFTTFSAGFPSTCQTTITVIDAEAPTFDPCPADMVFNLDPGLCGTIISYEVDAFDNCPPSSNFYQIGNPSISQAINCNNWGAGITNLNYHYRTFAYPGASNENFDGINVAVGQDPGGLDLIVRVYELDGTFPGGTQTLIGEGSAGSTPGGNNYFLDVAFNSSAQVSTGASLLLEVETPQSNNGAFGLGYGPGNDPTWIQSAPCGAASPTPVGALGLSTGLIFGVNTSNPPVAIVRLDAVPYTSGDEWPIGSYDISYEATDAVGNTSQCDFNIAVNEYANATATLACNDAVEIALPESGSTEIGADMILEGGPYGCYDDYEVEVDGNGNTVGCDDVGSTLSVLVTDPDTGNSCFGNISIVDNIDPQIECSDFAVSCTYDLADLAEGTVLGATANLALGAQASYDASSQDFEFELNAGPSALITDVTVDLDISHTWVGDLAVTLVAPSGTSVTLFAGSCGTSDDVLATFTDAGAPLACGGTPVIAGDVQPQSPFAALAGEGASGTWTLTVADNAGGDPTNINALGLNVSYESTYSGPIVTEACDYDVTMESIELAGDCDGDAGTVVRQYTVTDASGNSATCEEIITIIRPTLSDVAVPPSYDGMDAAMLDCSGDGWDTNGDGYPDVSETGGPTIDGQPFENGSSCNISVTYDDVVIDICAGSFKVRREWLVIDWCTGEEVEYNQLIKIMDTSGPDVNAPAGAITVEVTAGGADCTGDIAIAPLLVNGDDCSGVDESTYETEIWTLDFVLLETVSGNGGVFSGYDLTAYNPANNNNAAYFIRHTYDDNCGNETQVLYQITVIDKVAPTAICDEITDVALNSAGSAVVFAETFDDGSYDNCGDVHIYAARLPFAGYPMAALNFYDSVEFDCADVGESHMVVMLVLDFEPEDFYFLTDADGNDYLGGYNLSTPAFDGSWNACMVEVEVEDKLAPYLAVPGNLEITCDVYYADLAAELDNGNGAILDDMFGTAVSGDNCEAIDDYSYTYSVDQCGEGSINRSWTVNDPSGNGPVSGSQTITITHVSNWSVSFPGDLDATCVDGALPDFGQATVSGDNCEMIAISSTDTQFDVVPDACYKIIREWSAINWCTYPDEAAVTGTQVIKVTDNEAPIFDVEDFTVEITEGDCDTAVSLPTPDVT